MGNFVKSGAKIKDKSSVQSLGILDKARDWKLNADLLEIQGPDGHIVLPAQVIATSLRPDIYLISVAIKILIIIELTSPLEENMLYWRKTKSDKYESLISNVYAGF